MPLQKLPQTSQMSNSRSQSVPGGSLCWEEPEGSPRALNLLQGREGADNGGRGENLCTDLQGVKHQKLSESQAELLMASFPPKILYCFRRTETDWEEIHLFSLINHLDELSHSLQPPEKGWGQVGISFFFQVPTDRTRGNSLKLCWGGLVGYWELFPDKKGCPALAQAVQDSAGVPTSGEL